MLHAQSPFRSNQFQECSNLPSTEVLNPTCSSTFTGTNFLCANSPSHNRSCLHCSLFAISTFNACSSSLIPNRASSCSQSLGSHTIGSNALGLHASIQGVRRFGLGIPHLPIPALKLCSASPLRIWMRLATIQFKRLPHSLANNGSKWVSAIKSISGMTLPLWND